MDDDRMDPRIPTPTVSRREGDFVTPAQLELLFERFGRTMDSAVSTLTSKIDLMQVDITAQLKSIEQNMNFQDRTLSSRIDANTLRLDTQDKKMEELSTRGSRNFRLALTSLILPITVALTIYIVEKVLG